MSNTAQACTLLAIPFAKAIGQARTWGSLAAVLLLIFAILTLLNAVWRGVIEKKIDDMGVCQNPR